MVARYDRLACYLDGGSETDTTWDGLEEWTALKGQGTEAALWPSLDRYSRLRRNTAALEIPKTSGRILTSTKVNV